MESYLKKLQQEKNQTLVNNYILKKDIFLLNSSAINMDNLPSYRITFIT